MNNDFISKAFSSSQQAQIATVTNQNPNNPEYGTKGGNATQDKIFALSIDEAEKYFSSDSDRKAYTTDYAHKKNIMMLVIVPNGGGSVRRASLVISPLSCTSMASSIITVASSITVRLLFAPLSG